jgi:hypothetical protein
MNHENNLRARLKLALFDLEIARNKRRVGSAVRAPHADMQRLDTHVAKSSDVFNKLMQKLICQQSSALHS